MESNNAVIYDAKNKQWLRFSEPLNIYAANEQESVLSTLNAIEVEVAKNHYAVGFVAYEAAPAFDPALTVNNTQSFPLLWFAIYQEAEKISFPDLADTQPETLSWNLSIDEDEYHAALKLIKEYIHQGDTYQVNYSFRMRTPFSEDPWQLFVKMIHAQGYGYGAYINTDDWCICSASPELFFHYEKNQLISRPMKGTVPRGMSIDDDKQQADWLKNSAKNRAENLMIVDMVRNDMGQIAETGSVKTSSLFDIEKYPTLWQMTSTVQAATQAGIGEIFRALFPAASITGAPKARTMEIISELENDPRKIYTGSIGFIKPDNSAQFNVAIRTVLIDKNNKTAEYGVGGGIVWDSDSENELEECYTKAKVLTHVQQDFELLETILWTPEESYSLLQYHLDRLSDSAEYFSWNLDPGRVKEKLQEVAKGLSTHQHKIRLRITRSGEPLIETSLIEPARDDYRIHLAKHAIDSKNDLFLYHKTTRRQTYEKMLAEYPEYDDVLLFNENEEVTESCIANVVIELDGELVTPPVACGLLPGTYRRYLLEQGEIKERVIKLNDLESCARICLINSVRGKWEVTLKRG